jgi:prepilin-type N-terminal cleavage/methylation domain-containing protein
MCTASENNDRKIHNKGFTLVELIVVIAITAILATVAAPSFVAYTERAKEQVCNTNCLQLERMYDAYLILEDIEHIDFMFVQYLQEYGKNICPDHGDISYVDGKVQCNVHTKGDDAESDDDDESIPFL